MDKKQAYRLKIANAGGIAKEGYLYCTLADLKNEMVDWASQVDSTQNQHLEVCPVDLDFIEYKIIMLEKEVNKRTDQIFRLEQEAENYRPIWKHLLKMKDEMKQEANA